MYSKIDQTQWFMPVIWAAWEVQTRRINPRGWPRLKVNETPFQQINGTCLQSQLQRGVGRKIMVLSKNVTPYPKIKQKGLGLWLKCQSSWIQTLVPPKRKINLYIYTYIYKCIDILWIYNNYILYNYIMLNL
jgi:hypothetical protein